MDLINCGKVDLNIVAGKWNDSECLNILFDNENIRVEHVFMPNKSSPHEFWYDVPEDEWGVIISGCVKFEYQNDEQRMVSYEEGQCFYLPRHTRHRIVETSSDCIVLCVFVKGGTINGSV